MKRVAGSLSTNLGEIRSRGVELDAEARVGARLVLALGGTLLNASVLAAPDRTLVGKRVPQVPRRQGGAQIRYDDPHGFTFGVQARFGTAASSPGFQPGRPSA